MKKGERFIVTSGSYSDYRIVLAMRATKRFSPVDVLESLADVSTGRHDFCPIAHLEKVGLAETDTATTELHIDNDSDEWNVYESVKDGGQ